VLVAESEHLGTLAARALRLLTEGGYLLAEGVSFSRPLRLQLVALPKRSRVLRAGAMGRGSEEDREMSGLLPSTPMSSHSAAEAGLAREEGCCHTRRRWRHVRSAKKK